MSTCELSASILACDFYRLGDEIESVIAGGVDGLHLDIMDHHFVPNLSFGAVIASSLSKHSLSIPMDVHLMVDNPDLYITPFSKAGVARIVFHPETAADPMATIQAIREQGVSPGIVLNPGQQHTLWPPALYEAIDHILFMSVHPGFSGQSFMPEILPNMQETVDFLRENSIKCQIGIDGGIAPHTIQTASQAGAEFFVVGSALFGAADYTHRVQELRSCLIEATE